MSKYIIELGEEANMVQTINVTQNGNVYVNAKYVTELKELTSDYINEHYGSLQDDAYQRGFEDGKWKSEDGCTGCKYEGKTGEHLPCDYCMNNFKNQWTAKDDKIEVGDEVETKNGTIFVVTKVTADNLVVGLINDGSNCIFRADKVVKTGRHFDIASILEDMRND